MMTQRSRDAGELGGRVGEAIVNLREGGPVRFERTLRSAAEPDAAS